MQSSRTESTANLYTAGLVGKVEGKGEREGGGRIFRGGRIFERLRYTRYLIVGHFLSFSSEQ